MVEHWHPGGDGGEGRRLNWATPPEGTRKRGHNKEAHKIACGYLHSGGPQTIQKASTGGRNGLDGISFVLPEQRTQKKSGW